MAAMDRLAEAVKAERLVQDSAMREAGCAAGCPFGWVQAINTVRCRRPDHKPYSHPIAWLRMASHGERL